MGGMSKSQQSSRSRSQSASESQTFVDPRQQPFLQFLRDQGQQLAVSQMQQIGGVADQLSGALGGVGQNLLGILTGQASQPQALQGQGTLDAIAQGGNGLMDFQDLLQPGAQLEGQLNMLDEAIQRNLGSTLGTVSQSASLAGQSGGDREAFFAQQAAGDAQRAFAGGASDLLAGDLAARRGLAGTAAQLASTEQAQRLAAAQSLMQGGLQQQAAGQGAALGGLGALGGLMNLGLAPFQAAFSPLQQLGALIGGPTVLSQASASSTSRSRGQSSGQGFTLGVF